MELEVKASTEKSETESFHYGRITLCLHVG